MLKGVAAILAAPFLIAALSAQVVPSTSLPGAGLGQDGTLYPQGNIDCSDPSAPLAACAGRLSTQQSTGGTVGGGQGGASLGSGITGMSGLPSQPVTYNDYYQGETGSRRLQTTPRRINEPLTEFQQFTAATTGQVLPVFAADLFDNVPSTFSPLDNAPIPPDYVVGPDDELRIRVWGKLGFSANLRVSRAGDIFVPQVGDIHVAGLSFSELEPHIREAIARVYRNFDMTVDIGRIHAIQIYVTGVARRPGVYTISALSTLVDALFASGGPSVQGSMRQIELRRAGMQPVGFDLYDLLVRGDKSHDSKLASGDIVYIPPVGPQAAIFGSIRRPAIYELRKGDTIADLLKEAGGASAIASESRASLERIVDHNARETMEVALDSAGLQTALAEGDIVRVLSVLPEYKRTVTLRGNVANPGRYAWHDGMRLSNLIPDRESLITRDYWWKRTQLGLPALEYEPLQVLSTMRQPNTAIDLRNPLQRNSYMQQPNYRYGLQPYGSVYGTTPYGASASGNSQSGASALGASALGASALGSSGQQAQDIYPYTDLGYGAPNDETQQNYGQLPERAANERGSQSALAETDHTSQPASPPPAHRTTVRLSAPEIDWGYAVIERMDTETLKTSLVPFDLGKLVMGHETSQDLELKPGDVVSVFSQADIHVPINQQTKFVRLDGEFVHAGTYSVLPGETLRSLVQRAGGLTPNAYLYGSEFARESTRAIQQRRIDESIQNLTLQMQRGNLALASSPISSAQDFAGATSAQSSERELIAQLKQIRATGRIVLEFKPDSAGAESLPDIPLENGDIFLIPSLPSTVNVVGAVFNQNSFLYRSAGQAGYYLRLAGGPNTYADRKHMFVVRANGAVVNREAVHSAWGDEFDRLRMNPGDTLVVPEKGVKPSILRSILDISGITSQFALGAAAIDVLR